MRPAEDIADEIMALPPLKRWGDAGQRDYLFRELVRIISGSAAARNRNDRRKFPGRGRNETLTEYRARMAKARRAREGQP